MKKNRAFTLTELLVVVIVIGVLAMVALPKFSKAVETRKVTEAEDVMRAIRTEQEKRCSLDKNYSSSFETFGGLIAGVTAGDGHETEHYSYTLDTTGVSASSKGHINYTLSIPSYADGRICCSSPDNNEGCNKLNKDYPKCDDLVAATDYVASSPTCSVDLPEGTNPGPYIPPTPPSTAGCEGDQPESEKKKCCEHSKGQGIGDNCGWKYMSYVCNLITGEWVPSNYWFTGNCHPCTEGLHTTWHYQQNPTFSEPMLCEDCMFQLQGEQECSGNCVGGSTCTHGVRCHWVGCQEGQGYSGVGNDCGPYGDGNGDAPVCVMEIRRATCTTGQWDTHCP